MQDVYALSYISVSIVSICGILFISYQFVIPYKERRVFGAEGAAAQALRDWRLANPTAGVGDSLHAQMLVMRRIRALERCFPCCFGYGFSYAERIAELGFLYALLEEHTDPPPRPFRGMRKKSPARHTSRGFSLE